MKVVFPINQKTIRIRIPNVLIFNRFSFWLIKLIFGFRFYPLARIKYKEFKPLIKMIKSYKDFEIVNINTRQGENIIISI